MRCERCRDAESPWGKERFGFGWVGSWKSKGVKQLGMGGSEPRIVPPSGGNCEAALLCAAYPGGLLGAGPRPGDAIDPQIEEGPAVGFIAHTLGKNVDREAVQ